MTPYTSDELRSFLLPLSFQGPIEPFLVFADWLEEHDDPWGNLIAIDGALETRVNEPASTRTALEERRAAILAEHGAAICALQRWPGARLVYRRGFVASAALGDCGGLDANELAARLAGLLSSPAAFLLERLDLSASRIADRHATALLAEKDRLGRTRVDLRGNQLSAATAEHLRRALPNVDLSDQSPPPRPAAFAASGSDHRTFIRIHGARSIEDIDD